MRVDTTGSLGTGWANQNTDASSTTVSNSETTMAQVAARLGVSPEALQNANPQINPNALTAGLELRLPQAGSESSQSNTATQELPADASMSSASKRMESDLNTMQMRAMLDTAGAAPASTGNTSAKRRN